VERERKNEKKTEFTHLFYKRRFNYSRNFLTVTLCPTPLPSPKKTLLALFFFFVSFFSFITTLTIMRSRILRDIKARQSLADNELTRQAYRYVTRNETLPARVRHQAQLALNAMPKQSSPAFIANRCVATGHGSGILREFKLCRFQFRLKALNGELPGVKKSSW
jgi:small subunit ribosomal protein S14